VVSHVLELLNAGVPGPAIAVQSPYLAQVELLQQRLAEHKGTEGVEVASIDSFQGREADAVIISMVRGLGVGRIGDLA
jgi:superfamily I DNA and/or RNA helicase